MAKSVQEVFTEVYEKGTWKGGFPETASGAGSRLDTTEELRAGLAALFADPLLPAAPRVLDAPCGDFNWFREVRGYGSYVGLDIVPAMVAENTRRYASPQISFACADIARDPLPAADLMICRDCLIHLPIAMAYEIFENFLRAGIPWLLASTYANEENVDSEAGGYRQLNLQRPPFGFPEPVRRIRDDLGPYEKYMGLWSAAQVASVLEPG